MQVHPFDFVGGVTIYFWCGGLDNCCLFLQCEQAVIHRVLSVFPGRRRQWVGSVSGCWALGSKDLQEGGTGYS